MTTNDVRKLISNNQLQQALSACDQLELSDELKSKLIALKAAYREYNNHRIDGDMRSDDLEISRAGLTKRMLLFLSEYEILYITDFKNDFVALTDNIEQNVPPENKEAADAVVTEAKQIATDMQVVDTAEKKEDIKPGLIQRVGDFLAKFHDKDSTQSKILSSIKDGVSVVQDLGKKYNSIAQWFLLPQIPTVLL
ncbi:MAG: hypothetical protein ABJA35_12675 [Parafilimonas sp.]